MPFCDPSKIKIGQRFRGVNPSLVEELAESIQEVGQLQPVLVTSDMQLVDGLHRLKACETLGREVWYEDEDTGNLVFSDPVQLRRAELQANLKRRDFTPLELSQAIAELDALMKKTYGEGRGRSADGWSYEDTARLIGYKSKSQISEAVAVAKASEVIPALSRAKTMREAVCMVRDAARREAMVELARRHPEKRLKAKEHLLLGDCRESLRQLPSGCCRLFVTDPPFGVNLPDILRDWKTSRSKSYHETLDWEDKEEDIFALLKDVVAEMARVGKPDCQVFMFTSSVLWWRVVGLMSEAGFNALRFPYIWLKANPDTFRLAPARVMNPWSSPSCPYELAVYAWRGEISLAKPGHPAVLIHPPVPDAMHPSQKPVSLMEDIISRLAVPSQGDLIIDPFAGTGSTLVAAYRLGWREILGMELNEETYQIALSALSMEVGQ